MGVPPSTSVAVTLQVSSVDVVTPVAGLTLMAFTVGAVFSTVTLATASSVPPLPSVAVTVQWIASPGLLDADVNSRVSPVPNVVVWVLLVQV